MRSSCVLVVLASLSVFGGCRSGSEGGQSSPAPGAQVLELLEHPERILRTTLTLEDRISLARQPPSGKRVTTLTVEGHARLTFASIDFMDVNGTRREALDLGPIIGARLRDTWLGDLAEAGWFDGRATLASPGDDEPLHTLTLTLELDTGHEVVTFSRQATYAGSSNDRHITAFDDVVAAAVRLMVERGSQR